MIPSIKYPTTPGTPPSAFIPPTKFDYYGGMANWPMNIPSPWFNVPPTPTLTPPWLNPPTTIPNYPGEHTFPTSITHGGGRPWQTPGNNYTTELSFYPNRPGNYLENFTCHNPLCYDATGNRWFNIFFDMRGYRPDEICASLDAKNRCICVEACQECKEEDFYVKREYHRKYCFPENLKVDVAKCDFKSWLSNDGVLCIETQLPRFTMEEARTWSPTGFPMQMGGLPTNVYPVNFKTTGTPHEEHQRPQQQKQEPQQQQQKTQPPEPPRGK